MKMNLREFEWMIDDLVRSFDETQGYSILEFLDNEGVNTKIIATLNPEYLIKEIHKINSNNMIRDINENYTPRFRIVMGICEMYNDFN